METIYFDYAAATPLDSDIFKKMTPYFSKNFGNPSSLHALGREAKHALEEARMDIAKLLGANPEEIIFTGSGTESDNLALFGIAESYNNFGRHIVVSNIEHKAVLEAAKKLKKRGFEITHLPVHSDGLVDTEALKKLLRKDTILVSIMYANNEIGTIQPISEIAEIISEHRKENNLLLFHTDACQAAGACLLDVKKLGVDLMTLNGAKIYGPKGVGCLYKRRGVRLEPAIVGGGQERGYRAGSEDIALIVGFAEALKLAQAKIEKENKRLIELRDYCIEKILQTIPKSQLNGHATKRLPNNINISIFGIEGEAMVLMLDRYGICASTGSACAARDLTSSHVLRALGLTPEFAHGSLRITFGRNTTKKQIDYFIKILENIVSKLRNMSSISV